MNEMDKYPDPYTVYTEYFRTFDNEECEALWDTSYSSCLNFKFQRTGRVKEKNIAIGDVGVVQYGAWHRVRNCIVPFNRSLHPTTMMDPDYPNLPSLVLSKETTMTVSDIPEGLYCSSTGVQARVDDIEETGYVKFVN